MRVRQCVRSSTAPLGVPHLESGQGAVHVGLGQRRPSIDDMVEILEGPGVILHLKVVQSSDEARQIEIGRHRDRHVVGRQRLRGSTEAGVPVGQGHPDREVLRVAPRDRLRVGEDLAEELSIDLIGVEKQALAIAPQGDRSGRLDEAANFRITFLAQSRQIGAGRQERPGNRAGVVASLGPIETRRCLRQVEPAVPSPLPGGAADESLSLQDE